MDIRTLQFFLETCEQVNITKAAKNLYISQQGLSKAISKLEKEFGSTLFDRTTNGLELTECGEILKSYGTNIIEQYQMIVHQMRILKSSTKESLSIGYAEGIFFMLPKNFISEFMIEHPDINIVFKRYPDKNCEQALLSKEVDLCICSAPYSESMFRSLFHSKSKIFAVINNENPLSSYDSISLNDLKNERVIALNKDTKHYGPFTENLREYGIFPKIFINPAEMNIQSDLCSANMAIGFFSGNPEYMPKNVKLVPVKDLSVSSQFHVLSMHDNTITKSMDCFIESIKDSIETGFNNDKS